MMIEPATIVAWLTKAAPNWPVPNATAPQVVALTNQIDWLYRTTRNQRRPELIKRDALDGELQAELGNLLRPLPRILREMTKRGLLLADEGDAAAEILRAADFLIDSGILPAPARSGPREKRWYSAARLIAEHAIRAWATVDRHASHQTQEGPLVDFVFVALGHVLDGDEAGVPSHAAIAKALQRTRQSAA